MRNEAENFKTTCSRPILGNSRENDSHVRGGGGDSAKEEGGGDFRKGRGRGGDFRKGRGRGGDFCKGRGRGSYLLNKISFHSIKR